MEIIGYVEPRPGIPPSPKYMEHLIRNMRRNDVKVIIAANYFVQFLQTAETPFLREKALELLIRLSGDNYGYDAVKKASENRAAIRSWQHCWQQRYK